MRPEPLLETLKTAGKLKLTTRHCWTETDRKESVADHSWRLALMAMLMKNEPEFSDIDMDKVIRMCLIHDLGEAFTGDIPSFLKSDRDAQKEDDILLHWVAAFPGQDRDEWLSLLEEMNALETKEARVYKALDKTEALISHDESDIATWIPTEFELQKTYGQENMTVSPYFTELRKLIDEWTDEKIGSSRICVE